MTKNDKQLKKALVDFYNESRSHFENVPPFYNEPIPIPEAEIKGGHEIKEYKNTTFDVDFEKFKNSDSPMCNTVNKAVWKNTIYVNPIYYRYPSNLSGLLLFPPLHEMIHVKQAVLKYKNLEFKCKIFPCVDFSRAKELFKGLQSKGGENFRREIIKDGVDCFVMCDYLAQELLKDKEFKQKLIGERNIESSNQINWLTEHLYWFNRKEYSREGGMKHPWPRIEWF